MGYGQDVYAYFFGGTEKGAIYAGLATLLVLCLYLLDFFWPPHLEGQYFVLCDKDFFAGRAILAVAGLLLFAAALNLAETYPSVPIQCTVLLGPLLTTVVRALTRPLPVEAEEVGNMQTTRMMKMQRYVGSERDATAFYAGSMTASFLLGVLTLAMWLVWALSENIDFSDVTFGDTQSELTYIRWVSPVAVGLAYLMFGLIVSLRVGLAGSYNHGDMLLQMVTEHEQVTMSNGRKSVRRKTLVGLVAQQFEDEDCKLAFDKLSNSQKDKFAEKQMRNLDLVSRMIKVCGCVFVLMFGTTWMASQLVSSSSHLSDLVLGFLGVFSISFCLFVAVAFQRLKTVMADWCKNLPLYRLSLSLFQSDWVRALLAFAFSPLVPIVLVLSCMNQKVRKFRGLPTITYEAGESSVAFSPDTDAEQLWLTQRVSYQVEAMREDWEWISIFMKMYVFGLLMLLYVTFPILLNIFLSWLSSSLQGFDFGVVCLLIVVAGMCCFLLPPVPGVPVYLFAGIIIADKCPQGFEAGAAIAIGVGFVLKLMACAMQQKLIGECLGANLTIRTQVGINTPMIRAIEAVLRKPGMSIGKVSILCGGPDWPTSVLAGILRLSLFECELGTLPIIFFVAACSLSGSFYLKQNESELWDRAATFMMSASVFLCMLLQIMGAWAIQTQLDQNEWELTKPLEQNVELDWLDFRWREMSRAAAVRWSDTPVWLRVVTLFGILLQVLVGQVFYWRSSLCFGEFEVTDDINSLQWWVDGESGLILLPGLVCCCLSIGGWAFYFILSCWLKRQQAKPFADMAKRLDAIEKRWKDQRRDLAAKLAALGACRDNWEEVEEANEAAQEMLRNARAVATE
ncbi:unnamed protein product [Symbiodinium natans]|uniref:Uncharacterized protein n=1 Tax=Symbiodinium natans TaxID=878477 RepID=A0A812V2D3_9DINO|nr:unnamed protein product [Symbiodinium natans]